MSTNVPARRIPLWGSGGASNMRIRVYYYIYAASAPSPSFPLHISLHYFCSARAAAAPFSHLVCVTSALTISAIVTQPGKFMVKYVHLKYPEVGFLNILRLFHTTFQLNEGIT